MLDDFAVSSAEASSRAQGPRERSDDHVDLCCRDVLRFGYAAAGAAEDAVGPCFVEDEAEFVLEFEFDLVID